MKSICLLLGLLPLFCHASFADEILSQNAIKSLADRVRDYRNGRTDDPTNDNWIGGTYYAGLLAMYESTADSKYLDQCLDWGKSMSWKIPQAGKGRYDSGFYSLACGQIWYGCYQATKDESLLAPTLAYLENPNNPVPLSDPLGWHYENSGFRFVDGLFTAPPMFAMLYQKTGDEKYVNWMDACFWDVYGELYDTEEDLYYRDARYKPGYPGEIEPRYIRPASVPHAEARNTYMGQTSSNGEKILWSRGNGWSFGGLTRILNYLPKEHGSYARYEALFIRMAESLKSRQQSDGFWRPNLADPLDYDVIESSGTAFFTYGIAWGINKGILPKQRFQSVVENSWSALASIISDEGKMQWVQLSAGAPYKVIQEDATEYGSGIFLLAASEMYKFAQENAESNL